MSSFLPEDDRDYLSKKQLLYRELEEQDPGLPMRQAVLFTAFPLDAELYVRNDGKFEQATHCELLLLIPAGYNTTQLDSWYTRPRLVRANGTNPEQTEHTEQTIFGGNWQFWSRHLAAGDWRPGIDGLETYLSFVRQGLRAA